jgi:protein-tyrosine phosphatase
MSDPTAYSLGGFGENTDPLTRRLNSWSNHGNFRLQMPFVTQVADNLWHGGVQSGLVLPEFIEHTVSLYPWEEYEVKHQLTSKLTVTMYDSLDQGFEQVESIARWVNSCREIGPVLVSCQAGLNRSSLVVAKALLLAGEALTGEEAVAKIRQARDPACLCNPEFEKWVVSQ